MVGHYVDSPAGARIERGLVSKLKSTIFFPAHTLDSLSYSGGCRIFHRVTFFPTVFFSRNKIHTVPEKSSHWYHASRDSHQEKIRLCKVVSGKRVPFGGFTWDITDKGFPPRALDLYLTWFLTKALGTLTVTPARDLWSMGKHSRGESLLQLDCYCS